MADSKDLMRKWIAQYTDQIGKGIDVAWAEAQLADWNLMLNNQLAAEAAALAATPLRTPKPKAPTSTASNGPAPEAGNTDEARAARVKAIIEQTGVSRTEAERRVHLADGDLPIELMTLDELNASLRGMDPSVMGGPDFEQDGTMSDEDFAASLQALKDESVAANAPIGIDLNRSASITAERAADAKAEAARAAAVKGAMQANPHLTREFIEGVIAPASAFRAAPAVEADPFEGLTREDMGV